MAIRQKKLVGFSSDKQTVELDRNDIRRYARSIGSENPIHFDVRAAKRAGYADLVAPASMLASLVAHDDLEARLEVAAKNVFHSDQSVEIRRPLVAGDILSVESVITEINERPVGNSSTGFVTIEDRGFDNKGKALLVARRILAVRGGFPRR